MGPGNGTIYRFNGIEVDLGRGCVRLEGEERHLRKQSFEVLSYLLARNERLVSKSELFDAVWQSTAVTDDVLVQCIKEIRRVLGDDPHRPKFIKTVPRAGYRFIGTLEREPTRGSASEEITQVQIEYEEEIDDLPPAVHALPARRRPWALMAAAPAILVCLAAAAYFAWPESNPVEEVRLSRFDGKRTVGVMFFENQSDSSELDWLREGLADMLITDLSRSENLVLLSRAQLQILLERERAGQQNVGLETAMAIARKAGVDTILMGSFARIGDLIRLDVRIHDAATGELKGAENMTVNGPERLLSEIGTFSLRLLRRIDPQITQGTATLAASMTKNLEAYMCYSKALEKAQGLNKTEALSLLQRAIELDPEFAMAHARIGHTYAVTWGWPDRAKPHLARAFELSDRLTEKDRLFILGWYAIASMDYPAAIDHFRELVRRFPLDSEGHLRLGTLLRGEEQFEEAVGAFKQGLAVDPESPTLYNALGLAYSENNRHQEAIAMHRRYVELAPNEANSHDSLGMSLQWAGKYEEAIAAFEKALDLNPDFEVALAHLGVAYYQTGRYSRALEYFDKYLAASPSERERSRGLRYKSFIYRAKGDLGKSKLFAERAAAEHPANAWQSVLLAFDRGDRAAADRIGKKLLDERNFANRGGRLSPRADKYYRAYMAFMLGDTEIGLEGFRSALRHVPLTWDIDSYEDCLARALLQMGRYDEAITEFERVLEINLNYPLARFHIAEAYRLKGQYNEAAANYLGFLETWKGADPDIPEVIRARQMTTG